jgi:hypothetical protein
MVFVLILARIERFYNMKKQFVRLWRRPYKDGTSFIYYLRYTDLDGKFHITSLGHSDKKRAEKQ